ncbi:MAG TPA: hypothetical protein VM512_12760 [Burkholderiaceae bacterium]|nr:hypothetical protein [Burkholderiaceae bacterium]
MPTPLASFSHGLKERLFDLFNAPFVVSKKSKSGQQPVASNRKDPTAVMPGQPSNAVHRLPAELNKPASHPAALSRVSDLELSKAQQEISDCIFTLASRTKKVIKGAANSATAYKPESKRIFEELLNSYQVRDKSTLWNAALFGQLISMRRWEIVEVALKHGASDFFTQRPQGRAIADHVTAMLKEEITAFESDKLGFLKAPSRTRNADDALRVLRANLAQWEDWVEKQSFATTVNIPRTKGSIGVAGSDASQALKAKVVALTKNAASRREKNDAPRDQASQKQDGNLDGSVASASVTPNLRKGLQHVLEQGRREKKQQHSPAHLHPSPHGSSAVAYRSIEPTQISVGPRDAQTLVRNAADKVKKIKLGATSPATTLITGKHGKALAEGLLREYAVLVGQQTSISPDDTALNLGRGKSARAFDKHARLLKQPTSQNVKAAGEFKQQLIEQIRVWEQMRQDRLRNNNCDFQPTTLDKLRQNRPNWMPAVKRLAPPDKIFSAANNQEDADEPGTDEAQVRIDRSMWKQRQALLQDVRALTEKAAYEPLNEIRDALERYFNDLIPTAVQRVPLFDGEILTPHALGISLQNVWIALKGKNEDRFLIEKEALEKAGPTALTRARKAVDADHRATHKIWHSARRINQDRNIQRIEQANPMGAVVANAIEQMIRQKLQRAPTGSMSSDIEKRMQALPSRLKHIGVTKWWTGNQLDKLVTQKPTTGNSQSVAQWITAQTENAIKTEVIQPLLKFHQELSAEAGQLADKRKDLQQAARDFIADIFNKQEITPANFTRINHAIDLYLQACGEYLDHSIQNAGRAVHQNFKLPTGYDE